jgi:predicted transcriptional regulator YdeE
MNLTETPEIVTWPETHYVYVEKIGPFQSTAPEAWNKLHPLIAEILKNNQITGYTALYKMNQKIYRAGVSLAAPPNNLPPGLEYTKFEGGRYSRFVLTGPYSDLPAASGRVYQIVSEKEIPLRDDFGIENYLNDPRTTPAPELMTEILVPTA